MEILSVTLKNFKSHSDRAFEFQLGTNAICGENGAGKTSILEAIAWVLFDHKGDYKVEDLIRNGANSAQARVSFVSNRDQRTYEVARCTRSGYTIFDPQLGEKLGYTRIKEEVLPWLREHLGVAPGTDLARLFSNTIGVPQGTFTADFLQTTEKRKPIFDAILKVEEYRQVNQKMLSLEKYAKAETERLDMQIQQFDESLQEWDGLIEKRDSLNQKVSDIEKELKQWTQRLSELKEEQEKSSAIAAQVQQITTKIESLSSRIDSDKLGLERLKVELEAAEKSVEICTARRDSYQSYLQADQTLQELEKKRSNQAKLMRKRQKLTEEISEHQAKLAALTSQFERRSQLELDIKQLEPLTQQQTELEQQKQQCNQQLQNCQSWKQTLQRDQKRLDQLLQREKQLGEEIERLEALGAIVKQIPQLEEQLQRTQQQISRIDAATQFESDLRQILMQAQHRESIHTNHVKAATSTLKELQDAAPLWQSQITEILTTLENGSTLSQQLMHELQGILDDLSEQVLVDRLKQQIKETQAKLKTMRDQEAQYRTIDAKFDEEEKLAADIQELRAGIAEHQSQLAEEPELQQKLKDLDELLQALENPRDRSRYLSQELEKLANLEAEQQAIEAATQKERDAIAAIDAELETFENLTEQIEQYQEQRKQHQEDYQTYLEHQKSANEYKKRKKQLEDVTQQFAELQQQLATLIDEKSKLDETFDPEQVQKIKADYDEANRQQSSLSSTLPLEQKNLEECKTQLSKLEVVQGKRKEAQAQLKQKGKVERFIKFARKAYKEAAPRITERYVQSIAREADRLFRELMNRPNVALDWTRDYEIIVQEGAHSRRFINLSGGEQMCAALSVRLALLKVLADINVAFFDEPTTNMDKPRRESLAEAIANIRSFRQLFVISHDDTFEKVTENVIVVEREP